MTNKEATYILEDIKRSFATREDGTLFTATYNALNKAIKLLEQMPDEHGRLGDLDRLAKMVNGLRIDAMQKGSDTNPYWELGDIIAQAKTIVTAERSET